MASPNSSDLLLVNRDGVDYVTTYGEVFPTVDDLPLIPGPPVMALNGQPQTAPAEPGDPIVIIRDGDGPGSPVNQWQRGSGNLWTNIAGATGVDYEVTEEDRTFNIRLEQTFSDGSELYSNEIVVTDTIPLPWESWPGGVWHIKNVQNDPLALTGGPFTAWDIDGTNEREITEVAVGEELVFVTSPNCTDLYDGNRTQTWEFGDFTDTSKVTDMTWLFYNCQNFNADISNWNTSNVTSMEGMFDGAVSFNQDISGWDTSKVTNMRAMFSDAASFNADIGNWDTSRVRNMLHMFRVASVFNRDISNWNTSKTNNMDGMFYYAASFNQDLSGWCVSRISTKPSDFDGDSGFEGQLDRQPQWGTCP